MIDVVVECKIFSGLLELVITQVGGQFVKGGQHKLTRVYEHDVVDCKGRVVLHVVGDDCNFSMMWFNS